MISVAAPPPDRGCRYNTIAGNLLNHNHYAAHFHVCGPTGHRPCGGGQLDIEKHSSRVLVFGNRILNGRIDEDTSIDPLPRVGGIEIGPTDVHEVLIVNNQISDMTSHGVGLNWPVVDVDSIWVRDNKIDRVGGHEIYSLERASAAVKDPPSWGRCEGVPEALAK
jgi:hypothetical protein